MVRARGCCAGVNRCGRINYCSGRSCDHHPEGWVDGDEEDTDFPDQNGDWDEDD